MLRPPAAFTVQCLWCCWHFPALLFALSPQLAFNCHFWLVIFYLCCWRRSSCWRCHHYSCHRFILQLVGTRVPVVLVERKMHSVIPGGPTTGYRVPYGLLPCTVFFWWNCGTKEHASYVSLVQPAPPLVPPGSGTRLIYGPKYGTVLAPWQ